MWCACGAKEQLVAAAQAKAQVITPVGARIKSAQYRLDGLRRRAAGLEAERHAALVQLEKLDTDLADVNKQVAERHAALK